ncbi:hypothetical protein RRG08_012117 [Elysia crispata]|uniref:Uncharacterized protein n=1 Tax=Elysia crispata TaxID=231223 RepID=A0AAE1DKP7_9GAST|nr:hypothetical protein RRG08_012117 [Elysia crispata]
MRFSQISHSEIEPRIKRSNYYSYTWNFMVIRNGLLQPPTQLLTLAGLEKRALQEGGQAKRDSLKHHGKGNELLSLDHELSRSEQVDVSTRCWHTNMAAVMTAVIANYGSFSIPGYSNYCQSSSRYPVLDITTIATGFISLSSPGYSNIATGFISSGNKCHDSALRNVSTLYQTSTE